MKKRQTHKPTLTEALVTFGKRLEDYRYINGLAVALEPIIAQAENVNHHPVYQQLVNAYLQLCHLAEQKKGPEVRSFLEKYQKTI